MRDLSDAELASLQNLLDEWAAAAPRCTPLDVSAVDGYLCGVLLQPQAVPDAAWWPFVLDADADADADADGHVLAAAPPPPAALRELLRRRHAVLAEAIAARRWFDPWLFELEESGLHGALSGAAKGAARHAGGPGARARGASAGHRGHQGGHLGGDHDTSRDSALPWVAGFALAAEKFPALMRLNEEALAAPLALLYLHFDADDLEGLEDEPALAAALAATEPPADLAQAAEDLVRAVLLLADVSRPRPAGQGALAVPARRAPVRANPDPEPRSRSARPSRARRG